VGQSPKLQLSVLAPEQYAPPSWGTGLLHSRVLCPGPHDSLHWPQPDHPPLTGVEHALRLQLSELGPEQSAPPCWGGGLLHTRFLSPGPHSLSHGPQSEYPPSMGHGVLGHVVVASPVQPLPCRGLGLLQERVLTPSLPQDLLQVDQSDQPPFLHSRVSVSARSPATV